MLTIVEPGKLDAVREVCDRWDLDCTVIGEVTDSKMLRIYWHGDRVGDIPARRLADEAPVIRTPSVKPAYLVDDPVAVTDAAYPPPADLGAALTELLAAPNIADKRWVWEQYDYIVQANTVQIPGGDAGVLRVKGGDRGIAFANELSLICEKLGINVWELIRLANHHPRVNILQPGPGVGGHCIAVDPWFIVAAAPEESRLIRTAREVNDGKPAHVLDKIKAAVDGVRAAGAKPKVALLGLAFKPDVDDFRESPALHIAEAVAEWNNCEVLVSEPHAGQLPGKLAGQKHVRLVENMRDLIRDAHIVVMLVNHRLYNEIPRADLESKAIIDTRGVWS